tara:strand:- start:173 stop:2179 length:2007 start_codon:yes stop_codon:yes gene_type:complete
MIVFYVGYCYGRFELMFGQVKQGIKCIFNCCLMARTTFKNKESLFHLWRYLNLLHAAAYVSLTPTYKRGNLFNAFVEQHALLLDTKVRARFEELVPRSFRRKRPAGGGSFPSPAKRLACQTNGQPGQGRGTQQRGRNASNNITAADALTTNSMWSACMVWSLETIGYRYKCGDFSAPIHQQMTRLINELSDALHELELLEYQVLPYIYTHLVSLSCMIYLVASAFIKGAQCEVDESKFTSILLPSLAVLLQTITVIGLLEIGAILANPLSPAKEAFAICHLLNFTCANSLSVVSIDGAPAIGGTAEEAKHFATSTGRGASVRHATGRMFEGTELPVEDEDDVAELRQLLAIQTQQLQHQQAELQRMQTSSCRSTSQKASTRGESLRNAGELRSSRKRCTEKADVDSGPVGMRRCFSPNAMPGFKSLRPPIGPHNACSVRGEDKPRLNDEAYLGSSAHSSLRSTAGDSAAFGNGDAVALLCQLDSAPIEELAKVAALQAAQQEALEAQLAEEKVHQQRRVITSALLGRKQSRSTMTGSVRKRITPSDEPLEEEPKAALGSAACQIDTSAGGGGAAGSGGDDDGVDCCEMSELESVRSVHEMQDVDVDQQPSEFPVGESVRSHETVSTEEAFVNTHAVESTGLDDSMRSPGVAATASQKKLLMPVAGFME